LPVYTENIGQPRVATASEAEKILQRLEYTLETRNAYFWNKESKSFNKSERPVIYNSVQQENRPLVKQKEADLNGNSISEIYSLNDNKLTIKENSKTISQNFLKLSTVDFALANVNQEENAELITIVEESTVRFVEVWQWEENQFVKKWRSDEGNFSSLEMETFGGEIYIVANAQNS